MPPTPSPQRRTLSTSLVIAVAVAMLMGVGPGIYLVNRPDSFLGIPLLYAWGLVRTKSAVEGAPDELSLYATEGYWTGDSCQLRRYTYRIDGFVSMQAPLSGGEFVTRPVRLRFVLSDADLFACRFHP